MATIVTLKTTGGPLRVVPPNSRPAQCEIILFPGVRYERWADAPEPPVAARVKQRQKKRVLELAD